MLRRIAGVAIILAGALSAQNLLPDGGFEKGAETWGLYIPGESKDKGCAVTFDGAGKTGKAARLVSTDFARFITSAKTAVAVKAGESYRVSVWAKMGEGATVKPGAAGPLIRANLLSAEGKDGDHPHVFLDGRIVPSSKFGDTKGPQLIPKGWFQISGVITIPEGMTKISLNLSAAYTKGEVLFDDASVEKTDATAKPPAPSGTSSGTSATAANPAALMGFEAEGWTGGARVKDPVKEGSYSYRWNEQGKNKTIQTDKLAKDQTGTRALKFWVFSESANGATINVILTSRKDPKVFSYYYGKFPIDFTGWRQITIPAQALAPNRDPAGWNQIEMLQFNADGWGVTPKADTDLVFDAVEFVK